MTHDATHMKLASVMNEKNRKGSISKTRMLPKRNRMTQLDRIEFYLELLVAKKRKRTASREAPTVNVSLRSFIKTLDSPKELLIRPFYNQYLAWAADHGTKPLEFHHFTRQLTILGYTSKCRKIDGKVYRMRILLDPRTDNK